MIRITKKLEKKVKNYMLSIAHEYEEIDGLECTGLAENAADAFDIYEDEIDYVIPEEVFEWAFEVQEIYCNEE